MGQYELSYSYSRCVKYVLYCLFSWESMSEAIDDRLMKLNNCHGKWKEYEKHKNEVTNRVADTEEFAQSLLTAVVDTETEHQPDIDRIHVCVLTSLCDLSFCLL